MHSSAFLIELQAHPQIDRVEIIDREYNDDTSTRRLVVRIHEKPLTHMLVWSLGYSVDHMPSDDLEIMDDGIRELDTEDWYGSFKALLDNLNTP